MKNRVVITGLGVISPIGIGKNQFIQSLKNGVNGIDKITLFDATDYPSKVGAEIKNFKAKDFIPEKEVKKLIFIRIISVTMTVKIMTFNVR